MSKNWRLNICWKHMLSLSKTLIIIWNKNALPMEIRTVIKWTKLPHLMEYQPTRVVLKLFLLYQLLHRMAAWHPPWNWIQRLRQRQSYNFRLYIVHLACHWWNEYFAFGTAQISCWKQKTIKSKRLVGLCKWPVERCPKYPKNLHWGARIT